MAGVRGEERDPEGENPVFGALTVGSGVGVGNGIGYSAGIFGKLLPTGQFTFRHDGALHTHTVKLLTDDGTKFRVRFGEANQRLPETVETRSHLKLHIDNSEHVLPWVDGLGYQTGSVSSRFTDGQTYIVRLTTDAAVLGNAVPGSVNARGGDGQVRVSWRMPDDG